MTGPTIGIWPELQERLHAAGEPRLAQGAFNERDMLDLRVRVVEPMHEGRVYLIGDAAHLITPAAGKGMNLAIQDALEFGVAVRERYRDDNDKRLTSYTITRLPAIWRAQEFSNWMLTLLHAGANQRTTGDPGKPAEPSQFAYGLRRARLRELTDHPNLSRWFAHEYAGVDQYPVAYRPRERTRKPR